MLGVFSNQPIDKDLIRFILSAPGSAKGVGSISYSSWVVVCGLDIFENDSVSVVSESNLYNSHDLSRLVDNELQNDAHLMGLLYLKYGFLFLEKLRGLFSICIIDKKSKKVAVVTDRFGIKPVVYSFNKDFFIFGPRIKAVKSLMQSGADEIDY
ncbi:MAG: hypothetical protein HY753_00960, partial [Nitrospirae bacterium]|nr:hypothetical protein [Nitrospirota bacterium]